MISASWGVMCNISVVSWRSMLLVKYPEKTTDLAQVTCKLYHTKVSSTHHLHIWLVAYLGVKPTTIRFRSRFRERECTCILLFMLNMSGGCIPCILLFKHVKQVLVYCICIWLFVLNIFWDVTPYILVPCNRYGEMPLSRYFIQQDSVGEAWQH